MRKIVKKFQLKKEEPYVRADRDFRKQSIMTYRTLKLENLFMTFFAALFPEEIDISLESLLELFFERTGTLIETQTQIMIWVRWIIKNVSNTFNSCC